MKGRARGAKLFLYLLWREDSQYDEVSQIVVAAESERAARALVAQWSDAAEQGIDLTPTGDEGAAAWQAARIKLIGMAFDGGVSAGVIVADMLRG